MRQRRSDALPHRYDQLLADAELADIILSASTDINLSLNSQSRRGPEGESVSAGPAVHGWVGETAADGVDPPVGGPRRWTGEPPGQPDYAPRPVPTAPPPPGPRRPGRSAVTGAKPRPPGPADRLATATATLTDLPPSTPGLVRLAHAFNSFFQARIVAVMLDAESTPHRDAYSLTEGWCTQAMDVLADVAGPHLVRRYCPDHAGGEQRISEIAALAQFELFTADDTDVERIATAMISLAAELERLLAAVAADGSALPEQRGAAQAVAPAAHLIWSHFGGDAGGW